MYRAAPFDSSSSRVANCRSNKQMFDPLAVEAHSKTYFPEQSKSDNYNRRLIIVSSLVDFHSSSSKTRIDIFSSFRSIYPLFRHVVHEQGGRDTLNRWRQKLCVIYTTWFTSYNERTNERTNERSRVSTKPNNSGALMFGSWSATAAAAAADGIERRQSLSLRYRLKYANRHAALECHTGCLLDHRTVQFVSIRLNFTIPCPTLPPHSFYSPRSAQCSCDHAWDHASTKSSCWRKTDVSLLWSLLDSLHLTYHHWILFLTRQIETQTWSWYILLQSDPWKPFHEAR